jgi:hypothetical protein
MSGDAPGLFDESSVSPSGLVRTGNGDVDLRDSDTLFGMRRVDFARNVCYPPHSSQDFQLCHAGPPWNAIPAVNL